MKQIQMKIILFKKRFIVMRLISGKYFPSDKKKGERGRRNEEKKFFLWQKPNLKINRENFSFAKFYFFNQEINQKCNLKKPKT